MTERPRIVVLDGYTLNPGDLSWEGLAELGELTVYDRTGEEEERIIERALKAEVVLTNKTPLSGRSIEALPKLRYVGILATGYNVIDLAAATRRNIPVTHVPSYGTDSVAQMVFAHILRFCHHVAEHSESVKAGEWARSVDFCYWKFPLVELAGKRLGIIGFGRIGRRVADIARAFGMKVLAYDPSGGADPEWAGDSEGTGDGSAAFAWTGMDDLLSRSDIVSLNCPLTEENRGLMNAGKLAKMKKGSFLVNASRGPLVVDVDLAEALESGHLAGAGLDVLETEPPAPDNPLYTAPNVTITPHIAWATREARSRLMDIAADNLRAFLAGAPENVVNRKGLA
jgi:glycerate dehydrogenase